MMFQQQQLSQQSRLFIQNVHLASPGKSELISIAVARAIAWKLALPTMETSAPSVFYLESHDTAVRETLSRLNEMLVVDIPAILELTKQFWSMRYVIAFPPAYAIGTEADPMATLLGYSNSLSQDTIETMKFNTDTLLPWVNGFTRVFIDLGIFGKPTE